MSRFIRYLVCVFLPLSLVVNALAAEDMALTVKANAPQTYTVVKGDTLWDISALYLDNPWLWPRLWQINPEIDNPHLIYPGDKLTLVWRNGQPVLSLKPMVKLSPKVRVLEKKAVPTVQEGLVLPYLYTDRLLDKQTLQESQRVLGASDGKQYLTAQNQVVVIDKGLADQLRQGTMFDLIQAGSKVSGKKGQHQQNLDETLQLPSSLVGSLMVIRPYEHFSLALITDSLVPIGKSVIAVSPLKPELTIEPNEQADTDSVVKDDTAS